MQRFGEFFLNHWDLFLALAIILALLVWQTLRARLRGFKEIDPGEAVQVINRDEAVVLDVREESEYKEGHIANSLHIPLGSLSSRLSELDKFREKPILVGCRSGNRSAHACGMLTKQGFAAVYNLRGGVVAWQNAGLPVTKGGKAKKR